MPNFSFVDAFTGNRSAVIMFEELGMADDAEIPLSMSISVMALLRPNK